MINKNNKKPSKETMRRAPIEAELRNKKKLKIIYSSSDRRGICRTWLEEITRDNKFQSLTMSTACLNNKRTKYILADWNFYDQIK